MHVKRIHNSNDSIYFIMDSIPGDTVKYNLREDFKKMILKIAQNKEVIKWISDKTQSLTL